MKYKILIIICLLTNFLNAQSLKQIIEERYKTENTPEFFAMDSIVQQLEQSKGQDCLDGYIALYNYILELEDGEMMMRQWFKECGKEAEKQQIAKYDAYVKYAELVFLYNSNYIDEFLTKADVYIEYFRQHEMWHYYFVANNLKFEFCIFENLCDSVMQEMEEVYQQAKSLQHEYGMGIANYCFGFAYLNHSFNSKAIPYLEEAKKMFLKNRFNNLDVLIPTYTRLTEAYIGTEEFDKAIENCHQWEEYIYQMEEYYAEQGLNFSSKTWLFQLYTQYVHLYITANDLKNANDYLNKAEQNISPTNDSSIFFAIKANYYEADGQYEKALEYVNKQLKISCNKNDLRPLKRKIDILLKMNKIDEAMLALETFLKEFTETRNNELTQHLDEITTRYQVDKINAEKEYLKKQMIYGFVIAFFIIALLVIVIVYYERMHQKNKMLYKQIRKNLKNNEIKNNIDEFAIFNSNLATKLDHVMAKEKLFTDPNLTRKRLADCLETNETYLADAIRDAFDGVTFSEYINHLRLEYSCKLLIENNLYTIEAIAEDAGFGSNATFFRAFKKEYGMSPGDFRKMK